MKKFLTYFRDKIVSLAMNLVMVGLLFLGVTQINSWLGLKDDHPLEELAEKLIQTETGLDLDLTPATEEDQHIASLSDTPS